MATTWIGAADESRARVLQVARPQRKLEEIESMLNPEGRLQDREINSDARGRFSGGHTGEDNVGAVEHQAESATTWARRASSTASMSWCWLPHPNSWARCARSSTRRSRSSW